MSVYHVEKSELPVILFQADGSVMKGVVFLGGSTFNQDGMQTLADLMQEPGNFFPFRSDAGEFCIVNKLSITHIRFDRSEDSAGYVAVGKREEVDIRFVGGEQLSGRLTIEMPEGRTRVFDYINATKGFFLLESREAYYLVNVQQVRDASPRD